MLLAAALISVAIAAPQEAVQAPQAPVAPSASSSDSKPYTVSGVRHTLAGRKAIDYNEASHAEIARNAEIALRKAAAISISSRAMGWSDLVDADFDPSEWSQSGGGWHEQFVGMVGPQASSGYGGLYYGSTNGERLVAVASSIAVAWALKPIVALINRAVASPTHANVVKYKADRKQKKIDKIRAEIFAELAELERANAAARAADQTAVK